MKKGASKKHVTTSKQNLYEKPYGFCCDIKEDAPRSLSKQRIYMPPFLSTGKPNEGPDIKFRIHEEDVTSAALRAAQRSGQRGRRSSKRQPFGIGIGLPGMRYGGHRQRGGANNSRTDLGETVPERMVCQRCRGPLQWYLEDEIAVARDFMINRRIEDYNAEMDRNVKIAKKKEKHRRQRKTVKKKQSEEKEESYENEEKT
nr:PREDICTED: uncharacterized protein LOC105663354 [Megachile rotundata]